VSRSWSCSLAALALALTGAACGGEEKQDPAAGSATQSSTSGPSSVPGCEPVQAPAPKPDGERQPPRRRLEADGSYRATVTTNCGDFEIEVDVKAAPRTAASFVALAGDGFFEQTVFHRIVPGFVIQGGDPTGTGMGGPGYKTVDRPPRGAQYTKGVVAMAKAGDERPGTAGSQFFVVTAPDAGLPPDYALLGEVRDGLDVVDRIAQLGDPASGQAGTPLEPVVVEKVAVSGP